MGDVGSSFIGMVPRSAVALDSAGADAGVLVLVHPARAASWSTRRRLWCDASVAGERFHEAHRSHAYQYASRVHGSHRTVSLAIGTINVLRLLPIAVAARPAMD